MYKRIRLAYDGSLEGRTALRESAVLARQCKAEVFLLSVLDDTNTLLLSEAALAVLRLLRTARTLQTTLREQGEVSTKQPPIVSPD